MRALDDFLIDRVFQPAVDWCGRTFGWTQWGIAKQANYAALACAVILCGLRLITETETVKIAIVLGLSALWFLMVHGMWMDHSSIKDGAALFRVGHLFSRVMILSVFVALTVVGFALIGVKALSLGDLKGLIDLCCLYAMACGDPPAKEDRQTKLAMGGAV